MQSDVKAEKSTLRRSWHTKRHTSGVLRLGLGEHQYRGSEADEARAYFLLTVQKIAPAVVADLRGLWQRYGRVPASDLEGWARRYHLIYKGGPAAWVVCVAAGTCETWTEHPTWPADQFDVNGSIPSGELMPPSISPPAWEAHIETWPAYNLRLDQWRRTIAPRANEQVVRFLRAPEHFEWTVRFQIAGEKISHLAGASDLEDRKRAIRAAISETLSLIQLDRRFDPVGHPRK